VKHRVHGRLLNDKVRIGLVGVGGNGSRVLTGLAELNAAMLALGHPGGLHVVSFDPDKVSTANQARQPFADADVGLYKSIVLTQRVNMFYQTAWEAVPRAFAESGEVSRQFDILISCVDTVKGRRAIHKALSRSRFSAPLYWLDLGNRRRDGQVILGEPFDPEGSTVSSSEWASKGSKAAKSVVRPRLPTVMDVYPEMLTGEYVEDKGPSCSLAEALDHQDLFVNRHVSNWGLQLLDDLFRRGGVDHCAVFINLEDGSVNSMPVPLRVEVASGVKARRSSKKLAGAA
jgi:PRTRC genetic system ThiF family protein